MTTKRISFLAWVTRTQPIRFTFIHVLVPAMGISLLTDVPDYPWNIVGWAVVTMPPIGYWIGNYWYWRVKLQRGTKC